MSRTRKLATEIQKYFAILRQSHGDKTKAFQVRGLHLNLGSMVNMAEVLVDRNEVILLDAVAHGVAKDMTVNLPQLRIFASPVPARPRFLTKGSF